MSVNPEDLDMSTAFTGWNAYGQEATVVDVEEGQMVQLEGSAWWELVEAGTFKSEEELHS